MGNTLTGESKTKLQRLAEIQIEIKDTSRDIHRRLQKLDLKQRLADTKMLLLINSCNTAESSAGRLWVVESRKQRLALDIHRMRVDTKTLNDSLAIVNAAEDTVYKLVATEHSKNMMVKVTAGLRRIEHYEKYEGQQTQDANTEGMKNEDLGECHAIVCLVVAARATQRAKLTCT